MKKKVVIIGAGINGLVCANYLARGGAEVTILEKKSHVGGACIANTILLNGEKMEYSIGASVLGMMQDFIFTETGLSKKVKIVPSEEGLVYSFTSGKKVYATENESNPKRLRKYFADYDKIIEYIQKGFKRAEAPSIEHARETLGKELVKLWFRGSLNDLMDHYKLTQREALIMFSPAYESGPVSPSSKGGSFNVPLMESGNVFSSGRWGYVKNGIWQIPKALTKINTSLGVITKTDVEVLEVKKNKVVFREKGRIKVKKSDVVIFATDPHSAGYILGDKKLIKRITSKKSQGSSGKLILIFKKPIRWRREKDGRRFSDGAIRHVMGAKNLGEIEKKTKRIRRGESQFEFCSADVYTEGAAQEYFKQKCPGYILSIFCSLLGQDMSKTEIEKAKLKLKHIILERLKNTEKDIVFEKFMTPKDIEELYFYQGGNIDQIEIGGGQNFDKRTFSDNPKKRFYQFGSHKNIYYCGSGGYPCGSIAGTTGYMCAQEVLKK